MAGGLDTVIAAVEKWLDVDRDVLVRGDDGSGRSTTLQTLKNDAVKRGVHCVLINAPTPSGSGPLSPLLFHDLAAPVVRSGRRPHGLDLVPVFAEELQGRRNLLLLDDIDLFDAESVHVIEQVLRRTRSRLVASTTVDMARAEAPVRGLIAQRAPAEVHVEPFGYRAMSTLLTTTLGGPPDVGLISSIVTRSGGNPRVAIALADAGRFAGVVQPVDDVWTEVGALDNVPHDAVAHALGTRLSSEAIEALELLSWTGPLALGEARRLVDERLLLDLGERERVAAHASDAGGMLVVSPPALSRALRNRLTAVRRISLTERVAAVFGDDFVPVEHGQAPAASSLPDHRLEADDLRAWNVDLAGMVNERAAIQEAARRAAWRESPTTGNAVAFLQSIKRRPRADEIDEVFATTRPDEEDPEELRGRFRLMQTMWIAARGDSAEALAEHVESSRSDVGSHQGLLDLLHLVLTTRRRLTTDELDAVGDIVATTGSPVARAWFALVRVSTLTEAGQLDDALDELDAVPTDGSPDPVARYLEGKRTDVLLLLDRVDEAQRGARRRLEIAYDALDPVGIRVHALGLAQAQVCLQDRDRAWQTLTTALRLNPPGPFDNGSYERLLSLGAILQAVNGDLHLARILLREAESSPSPFRESLGSMRTVAAALIAYASGEDARANEMLGDRGRRDGEDGYAASAALCWTARGGAYTEAELGRIRAAFERAPIPLFAPYLRLHAAIAAGDESAITAAAREADLERMPALARATVDRIDGIRVDAGRPELTETDVSDLVGPTLGPQLMAGQRADGAEPEELSEREHEVAMLAREGLSNRQIAERLYLSVRTVENHMYRALRKLGLGSRAELQRAWPR